MEINPPLISRQGKYKQYRLQLYPKAHIARAASATHAKPNSVETRYVKSYIITRGLWPTTTCVPEVKLSVSKKLTNYTVNYRLVLPTVEIYSQMISNIDIEY